MRRLTTVFLSLFLLNLASFAAAEPSYVTAAGKAVGPLDAFRDCDVCPEMIVLPMGSFHMGSTVKEANNAQIRSFENRNVDPAPFVAKIRQAFRRLRIDLDQPEQGLRAFYARTFISLHKDPQYSVNPFLHEVPRHEVTIDMPIAMARNEITRAQWQVCVDEGGCARGLKDRAWADLVRCSNNRDCVLTPDDRLRFRLQKNNPPPPSHPNAPRTGVTFYEMQQYADWLNSKAGKKAYRLPTEAEWEYAARAGTTTRYAQGDQLSLEQANFLVARRELVDGQHKWNYDLGSARVLLPVDQLQAANGWGLRHMSGNAAEFTTSCGEGPHKGLPTSNAFLSADADRPDCKRALKGGMYSGNIELARPARRVAISASHWSPSIGFRVVRDLSPAHAVSQ